ncbi:hypothetical protein FACS18942_07550 [Planctomycetales bacterium]|nr:hypothetical protein FACS18942_07550 [Planctomycetales bacterium]
MPQTSRITESFGFLSVTEHPKFGFIGGYLILNGAGRPLEFHCTSPVRPSKAQEILYGGTLEPYLYGEQIAGTLLSRAKTPVSFVMTDTPAVLAAQENCEVPVGYVFPLKKKNILQTIPDNVELNGAEDEGNEPYNDGLISERQDTISLFSDTPAAESPAQTVEISPEFNESLKSFGIETPRLQSQKEEEELPSSLPEVAGLDTDYWGVFKIGNRVVALPGEDERRKNKLLETVRGTARTLDLAEPFTRIRLAIEEAQKAA